MPNGKKPTKKPGWPKKKPQRPLPPRAGSTPSQPGMSDAEKQKALDDLDEMGSKLSQEEEPPKSKRGRPKGGHTHKVCLLPSPFMDLACRTTNPLILFALCVPSFLAAGGRTDEAIEPLAVQVLGGLSTRCASVMPRHGGGSSCRSTTAWPRRKVPPGSGDSA